MSILVVIEHLYCATQRFRGALDRSLKSTTNKQDGLQAFPKKGKTLGEELKAQLLRKIVQLEGSTTAKLLD